MNVYLLCRYLISKVYKLQLLTTESPIPKLLVFKLDFLNLSKILFSGKVNFLPVFEIIKLSFLIKILTFSAYYYK